MTTETDLLQRVRDTLRADTAIGFDEAAIVLCLSDGSFLIDGEVADVSLKRGILREAAAVVAPRPIIDRLHVRAATPMADGMIDDLVRDALIEESGFANCRIRVWSKGTRKRCVIRLQPPARSMSASRTALSRSMATFLASVTSGSPAHSPDGCRAAAMS